MRLTFLCVLMLSSTLVGCESGSRALPISGSDTVVDDRAVQPAVASHVLHSFGGGIDGRTPAAGLILDSAGALYGTTFNGGSKRCGGSGCGTVFKLTRSSTGYKETILYAFQGSPDGQGPTAGLTMDGSGAVYGTTYVGGNGGSVCDRYGGCGTVFKLTPSGSGYHESVLYSFEHGADGAYPAAKVIIGTDGALYGTAEENGTYGGGTVFKLETSGKFQVIYAFHGGSDGGTPVSGLLQGPKGMLYGTTSGGGQYACGSGLKCGIVFRLKPSKRGYTESVLYNFRGGTTDGQFPESDLIADEQGALYGTTFSGGSGSCNLANPPGCGTVFKLTPSGSGYQESLLYNFLGGADGQYPGQGTLTPGNVAGLFYGATQLGGNQACSNGCGTVFEVRLSGGKYAEKVLYSFGGGPSGATPNGALTIGKKGQLFGTTSAGGTKSLGTAFRLTI